MIRSRARWAPPFVIDGHDVDAIVARLGDAVDAAIVSAAERR
jgi:hypothetical protein